MAADGDVLRAQKLLIFGATGLIGSHITRAILGSKSKFEQVVIFTSPDTIERKSTEISGFRHAGADILSGNILNEDDVRAAYNGIDTVISCLGRNMIAHQAILIRLAA